jgi:hypothetical protein
VRHRIGQSIAPVGARRQHHADQRGEQLATHEITGRGKSRTEAALWPRPPHCDGTTREKVGMHHLLVVMRGIVLREHSRSALVPRAMAPTDALCTATSTQKVSTHRRAGGINSSPRCSQHLGRCILGLIC